MRLTRRKQPTRTLVKMRGKRRKARADSLDIDHRTMLEQAPTRFLVPDSLVSRQALRITGHAIEARLYAEAPETGFLPSIGRLRHFKCAARDIRIDSAVEQDSDVTPYYDPMIAKLIAHAPNRTAAASRLASACRAVEIWPVKTNAAFLGNALAQVDYIAGNVDTGFIESHLEELIGTGTASQNVLEAAAMARLAAYEIPAALMGFRLNAPPRVEVRLQQGADTHIVSLRPPLLPHGLSVARYDGTTIVFEGGHAFAFSDVCIAADAYGRDASDGAILSPMPGQILAVAVAEGDIVAKGAPLVVMEAMKMEITLAAPFAGTVTDLSAKIAERVAEGIVLLRLKTKA
jgi:acetyl/propionyl-CoA carboxylase alpha subunit